MRRLLAFAAFLPALAFGQGYVLTPNAASGNIAVNPTYTTQAAVTLYVETTGSDANACTSVSSPCLTGNGALSKLPKGIAHAVSITFGTGTFATATTLNGFVDMGGTLTIQGTLTAATGLVGDASGTFTGATAGSLTSGTWATGTMASGTWPVNELRCKMVSITSGTGSGQIRMVSSNTGTVITVPGAWTAPTTSPFAIMQQGTVVSAATGFTVNGGNLGGGNSATSPFIIFKNFSFTGATGGLALNTSALVSAVNVTSTQPLKTTMSKNGSEFFVTDSCGDTLGNDAWVSHQRGGRVRADRNVVTFSGSGTGFNLVGGTMLATLQSNSILGGTVGVGLGSASFAVLEGNKFDRNGLTGNEATGFLFTNTNSSTPTVSLASAEIGANDFTGYIYGIRGVGPSMMRLFGVTTGTGNTHAIHLSKGAAAQVASTATITGTNEITLDNESTTLAAFRAPAAGNRYFRNSIGSMVTE